MDSNAPPGADDPRPDPAVDVLLRHRLGRRPMQRFVADPSSGRKAILAIVTVTALTVVVAAVAFVVFDPQEYPDLADGLWLAIQTVTTVGYGDVAPVDPNGRFTASLTMLIGAAIIAITTALITSAFVEARQALRSGAKDRDDAAHRDVLEASLADLHARLDRIERALAAGRDEGPPAPSAS